MLGEWETLLGKPPPEAFWIRALAMGEPNDILTAFARMHRGLCLMYSERLAEARNVLERALAHIRRHGDEGRRGRRLTIPRRG
jgi:hypothetical protein